MLFETVTKGLLKGLEDLKIRGRAEAIQITTLLITARIVWRVLETCCHSSSSEVPSANADVKNSQWVNNNNSCSSSNWRSWYSLQRIGTRTGGLETKRTSGDHLNFSITEISQNTEKNPGDLRRLAVTQTPVKDDQLTLMRKTLMSK